MKTDIDDMTSGRTAGMDSNGFEELPQFVLQFFMSQFGAKKVVQARLLGLISGLIAEAPTDLFVLFFARFSGFSGLERKAKSESDKEGGQGQGDELLALAEETEGVVFDNELLQPMLPLVTHVAERGCDEIPAKPINLRSISLGTSFGTNLI